MCCAMQLQLFEYFKKKNSSRIKARQSVEV